MWIDAWGEGVHTESACARRWSPSSAAGAPCWPTCWPTATVRARWRCPDPEDVAGRLVAALDGIGLHTTLHPHDVPIESAAVWARRLAELELGVTPPRDAG